MQKLKLVASTRLWTAKGEKEFPMWAPTGSNEYILGFFDKEPTLSEIGRMVGEFQHMLEGRMSVDFAEVYSGFELYLPESLTHNEHFQLQHGDTIDFPATDVKDLEGTE